MAERKSTAKMTPAEYKRTDTPGAYTVITDGARYVCAGLHSAEAVQASTGGTIKKGRHLS